MKSFLLTVFYCCIHCAGFTQPQAREYIVEGILHKFKEQPDLVYMNYQLPGGDNQTDSFPVKNGKYMIKGKIEEPLLAILHARYSKVKYPKMRFDVNRDATWLVIVPGKIKVVSTDSFSNIQVSGSDLHPEFMNLEEKAEPYENLVQELTGKLVGSFNNKKMDEVAMLRDSIGKIKAERSDKVYLSYAKKNTASFLSLYALEKYMGSQPDSKTTDIAKLVFDGLSKETRNTPTGLFLQMQIEVELRTAIGKVAPDFTQTNVSGKPVSLSSFMGKYVLLEFWASWCGPCRLESPNLVKAYHSYSGKGFEILSVSLDKREDRDKWIKAIDQDSLGWTHISDLKFWDNEVAKLYMVRAIPRNILLDPHGVIIAKDLRGEFLINKLKEIFTE